MSRTQRTYRPMVVIVGQTASGKSDLALNLAESFNGAILCADSRTVYAGMDIGTAKPTTVDQKRVQHYGLDLVQPDQNYTVANYQAYAQSAMTEIEASGRLPIMVGGSGLYIDSVVYDFSFRAVADPQLRAELSLLDVAELQARLVEKGLALPENSRNPRHLIRAIETNGQSAVKSELRPNTLIIGLSPKPELLPAKITDRVDAMLASGLGTEVRQIADRFGWSIKALQAPGYSEFQAYFNGKQSLPQTRELIIKHTIDLAKRQRTWFRRNKSVRWLSNGSELERSVDIATTFLNK